MSEENIKQKIKKFYDISSPHFFDLWGEHLHDGYYITGRESRHEAQENLVKFLAQKAQIPQMAKVLDVGCGMGGTSFYLAKNFNAETVGITISPVQVKMARKLAQERGVSSKFFLMDAEDMSFKDDFNVVWVVGVLTHLTDQERFIKKSYQSLRKGGKFVLGDWMLAEGLTRQEIDYYIKPILKGMVMHGSHPMNTYLQWFLGCGYKIQYTEDITVYTIKTWDIALSIIKKPAIWRLAHEEGIDFVNFLKSIHVMKEAMEKNKIQYGVIVAEKI